MTAVIYRSPLLEARVETVRSLINDLEVPAVVGSKDPVIIAPVQEHVFLTPSHLLSTALFSFSKENGSYHLEQLAIPKVQSPYGIYVPAHDPGALIHRVKLGDEKAFEALYSKYRRLIESEIGIYFASGYERADFRAIGHFALFDAACCYKFANKSFDGFLMDVLKKRIVTEIKTANRDKHSLLKDYASLDSHNSPDHSDKEGGVADLLGDFVPEKVHGPEETVLSRHGVRRIMECIARLSPLEGETIIAYAGGESYREIATRLGYNVKRVDNALQRAKRNLPSLLAQA